jgi:AraC-like DNA-binding protein
MNQDQHTHQRLALARAFIDAHYDQQLNLDRIAAEAGFSRYHFIRLFRGAFDATPHQYLTRRRIEQASELLAGTDLDVTEICFAVGFQSLGSFSTLFHRYVGHAPTGYRARVFSGWRAVYARIPICYLPTAQFSRSDRPLHPLE